MISVPFVVPILIQVQFAGIPSSYIFVRLFDQMWLIRVVVVLRLGREEDVPPVALPDLHSEFTIVLLAVRVPGVGRRHGIGCCLSLVVEGVNAEGIWRAGREECGGFLGQGGQMGEDAGEVGWVV